MLHLGLYKTRDEFQSWEWRFGRTPKFNVTKNFPLPQRTRNKGADQPKVEELTITVTVASGQVENIIMKIPPSLISEDFMQDINVLTSIRGRRFTEDALDDIDASFGPPHTMRDQSKQFVADCVRKVVASV